MKKPVLMIAYHYPPAQASGTQRTLGFARYLPEFGWEPLILSAHPRAYEQRDREVSDHSMANVQVRRPFALDAARHLAIRGRYARIMALPDRWSSWMLGALPVGMGMIRRHRPRVVWSTYPIATSLVIGRLLSRWSGLPWIVDLRDPMVLGRHPVDRRIRKVFVALEEKTVFRCDRVVVTTPGLKELMMRRYPSLPEEKWHIIPNGYDEEQFNDPELLKAMSVPQNALGVGSGPGMASVTLLHSGTLYTGMEERNPAVFLDALCDLIDSGIISDMMDSTAKGIRVRVIFRATGHDAEIGAMIQARNLGNMVFLEPTLPYRESLIEMSGMDGLLLFQGSAFDRLIPAKLFEYLRLGRPVFALVGEEGDSKGILDACGVTTWTPLSDRESIRNALASFLQGLAAGTLAEPSIEQVRRFSRREGTGSLARLLDETELKK
ncbi:MAG: glycosyltransferase [Magnetococcales bacterium]|nr:glycosyltransferase [Magnetococcales bacterium]